MVGYWIQLGYLDLWSWTSTWLRWVTRTLASRLPFSLELSWASPLPSCHSSSNARSWSTWLVSLWHWSVVQFGEHIQRSHSNCCISSLIGFSIVVCVLSASWSWSSSVFPSSPWTPTLLSTTWWNPSTLLWLTLSSWVHPLSLWFDPNDYSWFVGT